MTLEIEKKYLFDQQPKGLTNGVEIEQIYLDHKDLSLQPILSTALKVQDLSWMGEARIRSLNNDGNFKYFLTAKSEGEMKRREEEIEIDRYLFNFISNKNKFIGERILKTRYTQDLLINDNLKAEIDVYKGQFRYLVMGEVEFDTEKYKPEGIDAVMEDIYGKVLDVTASKLFKNKRLAKVKGMSDLILLASCQEAEFLTRAIPTR